MPMHLNMEIISIIAVVFSFAAFMHGLCGFGFSLISVGIFSLMFGPKQAVPLTVVASTTNCVYLMITLRKKIMFKKAMELVLLGLLFVPIGVLYLSHFNKSLILKTMGLVILIVAIISLFKLNHAKLFASKPFKWVASSLAGMLGGAFNMSGPPLVLYAYNCGWPIRNAMANLQLIFTILAPIEIIMFIITGLLTVNNALAGAFCIPLVVLFSFLGSYLSKQMRLGHLQIAVDLLLILLAVSMMF